MPEMSQTNHESWKSLFFDSLKDFIFIDMTTIQHNYHQITSLIVLSL